MTQRSQVHTLECITSVPEFTEGNLQWSTCKHCEALQSYLNFFANFVCPMFLHYMHAGICLLALAMLTICIHACRKYLYLNYWIVPANLCLFGSFGHSCSAAAVAYIRTTDQLLRTCAAFNVKASSQLGGLKIWCPLHTEWPTTQRILAERSNGSGKFL